MTLERRTFLKGSAAAAAVLGGPFAGFVNSASGAVRSPVAPMAGLVPIEDMRDSKVRLHLPDGFGYRSFHDTEFPVTLRDGTALPGRHDGMGAFRGPDDSVILIRNHEVNGTPGTFGPLTGYDEAAGGGTTTIRVTKQGEVLDSYTSCNGTMMNCSGGIMPWGSWITGEETVNGPDVGPDFTKASNVPLQKPHGYIFEVPVKGRSDRQPITRAGRFAHEAVSFDPIEGRLYLTEDNFVFASGFYRYTPRQNPMVAGRLDNDGELEMLAVKGSPNAHLEGHQDPGVTYEVEWVPIAEPNKVFPYTAGEAAPTPNDTAVVFVGDQGRELGAASFSRLEGQVYDDGVVYFTSTQGGGAIETGPERVTGFGNGSGQVWAYDTRNETLSLVYESPDRDTLDFPDNITVSQRGTLVLCEDNSNDNYVRGLSKDGELWNIALNRLRSSTDADRSGDEFAGSTFSPDGKTLFVNIQSSKGMTFAIWGPWEQIDV